MLAHAAAPTPPTASRWDYAAYRELPEDGHRYEILAGALAVTPSPTFRHQKIAQRLNHALYRALEAPGHGDVLFAPMDVILSPDTVAQPDLLFVARGRLLLIDERVGVAPDLVVEILSDSTRRRDVLVKTRLYAQFGVTRYWLVDPDADRVDFLVLAGDRYETERTASAPERCEAPGYAGLELDLAALFAP